MRLILVLLLIGGAAQGILVNDGSFENGSCDAGSDWTCVTNQLECETIVDPLGIWAYPAYEGSSAVWLGGVCHNNAISNSVCQDIVLSPSELSWWWMGWYTLEGEQEAWIRVTVDGELAYEKLLGPEHDTVGSWSPSEDGFGRISLRDWEDGSSHTLCIKLDNNYINNGETTANLLVDWIELSHPVATAEMSFSLIKVLY
jgi:hypothetical protein